MVETASNWAILFAYTALCVGVVLVILRMMRGPSLPDRVVALDLFAYLFIAVTGVHGIDTGHAGLLNVALALGIFVFLGTVAFARYLEAVVALQEEEEV